MRMTDPIAEERSVSDASETHRALHAAWVAVQDAERAESRATKAAEEKREAAARARLELGRALMVARKHFPARGPKAKGWGEFCAEQGFTTDKALDWMKLAGFVEVSGTGADDPEIRIPTYAEAGIKQRPPAPAVQERAEAP